ncbi:MAG: hypothetical protein WKG01_05075 [Kofleriaceae bacterium]
MSSWVADELGTEAFELLAAGLGGSALQSVLLEVIRRRARGRTPADVLAQYQRDRFTSPATVGLRTSLAIDADLLAAAHAFEALELSPVAPLGTCSTVALTDQHRVLSALRGTEVVSDPTNVLALECAKRLRTSASPHHLATSQRVIRAQPVPNQPGFAQHFRIFVLASGGIETRDHGFTADTLALQIRTLLAGLDLLEQHDYAFGARRIDLLATPARAVLADRIAATLPGNITRKPLDHPYYSGGLRYMLWVTTPDGDAVPLGDGGTFDWLQQLTSNRRAVFVASGLGAQLVGLLFRR